MWISFPDFQFTLEAQVRKLFQMRRWFLLLSMMVSMAAWAQNPSPEDLFQKGLAAYQNKRYDEARDNFQKLLESHGTSVQVLHNLALAQVQLGQKATALALWRKALTLEPGFRPARAGRAFIELSTNLRPFERDSFRLWLRRSLEWLSLWDMLWVLAVIIGAGGWLAIRYWGERQAALEDEKPMPPFPYTAILMAALFVAMSVLLGLKANQVMTTHATVTTDRANVRSLPAEDSVALFELVAGHEVIVKQTRDNWAQVQTPEGTSGWVKTSELFVTSHH